MKGTNMDEKIKELNNSLQVMLRRDGLTMENMIVATLIVGTNVLYEAQKAKNIIEIDYQDITE
jgi:hypothetical protein